MKREQTVLDVSRLPTLTFGPANLPWWGTVGYMLIEGFTLALALAVYFYLRLNEFTWPPGRTPQPDLLMPSINTVLILAGIAPMVLAGKAAERLDRGATVKWLLIAVLMDGLVVGLRWSDLLALNVRWDANAYASAAWAVVVLHGTLILTSLFENGTIAAIFLARRAEKKHFSDVSDAALYEWFKALSWVVVYAAVYWGPRVL